MKNLMLSVVLALVCGLQALDNSTEDLSKIMGDWFTIELASNVTSTIEEGGSLEIFIKDIGEHDGFVRGVFFKSIKILTSSFDGLTDNGVNDFSLQSVDSKHAMYFMHNFNNGRVTNWAILYGRTPDLPDEIKQKFEEMCERFGIRKDQIRDLSNDDQCEELR